MSPILEFILEFFSQAGKIEFEFSRIFRLCYLFSKLCLYIPIAYILSYLFTLLANFLAIVIPESELKVLALLVALISFLTSVSLEYYFLRRMILSGIKEKYKQLCSEIRSFCRNHKINSEIDFYKILSKVFDTYLTFNLSKNVKHKFLSFFSFETIMMSLAVLAVFKFFGMDITPLVTILSFTAFIPLLILLNTESKKESDKEGLSCFLVLIFALFLGDTGILPSVSFNSKKQLFSAMLALLLAPPWSPFLRVKNALPALRMYIFTITPRDLRIGYYTELVGWFRLPRDKQTIQKYLQEENERDSKIDKIGCVLGRLGCIAYEHLNKEFQDAFGVVPEDKKGGLIYLRNKHRNNLTPRDENRIFYHYFNWVRNNLNSFKSMQKDQKLTIKSFSEFDPNVLPTLFKNAVPDYHELPDYEALFDEEVIEALGDLGRRTLVTLATFKVENMEFYFLSKGQNRLGVRNLTEIVDAFFVLPVFFVIAYDENGFEDSGNTSTTPA